MEPFFKRFYQWLNGYSEPILLRAVPAWISPNAITYFRVIMLVPIFLLLYFDCKTSSLVVYVANGLLDYVDGALARSRKQESDWGKFIDAMTDKVYYALLALIVALVVFNANEPGVPTGILLLIVVSSVTMEALIAAIRTDDYVHNKTNAGRKRELKADYAGKIKLNLQLWGLGFLMLAYPDTSGNAFWTSIALIGLSLPFASISFANKNIRR